MLAGFQRFHQRYEGVAEADLDLTMRWATRSYAAPSCVRYEPRMTTLVLDLHISSWLVIALEFLPVVLPRLMLGHRMFMVSSACPECLLICSVQNHLHVEECECTFPRTRHISLRDPCC